ncbi:hypothetical protein [Rhizobium leguminosarum]|uniref:hypothetical protein n=1 Tax=Rhizobium TaxID=379 RepID=UPI0013EED3B2|nr:hypothetical protein [Rhizobium leguminosarum]
MATSHDPHPQTIVAFYIGLGFMQQGERLWRIDVGTVSRLAVDQSMPQPGRPTQTSRMLFCGSTSNIARLQIIDANRSAADKTKK